MTAPAKMTTAQVAELFGVTKRTVQLWADNGILPCTRTLGARGDRRFDRAVVQQLLDATR